MEGNSGMSYVNKDCDVTMQAIVRERERGVGDACAQWGWVTLEERERGGGGGTGG